MNKLTYINKSFSIESGSFEGKKRSPSSGGYLTATAIGAGLGAILSSISGKFNLGKTLLMGGVSALIRWMYNKLDKAEFNQSVGSTTIYEVIKYVKSVLDTPDTATIDSTPFPTTTVVTSKSGNQSEGYIWGVNQNQNNFDVSMAFDGTSMLLLVNDLSKNKMRLANAVLDGYCKLYKNAHYQSKKIGNNLYLVAIVIVNKTAGPLAVEFITHGISINFLTTDRTLRM